MLNYRGISKIIATLFYIGYTPIAPGTIASLIALLSVWIIKPCNLLLFIMAIILFIVGVICADITERDFKVKDSPKIVIDEFVGYIVSIQFLPLSIGYLLSAFLLFRFFDILKPVPIKRIQQRFDGGFGIMFDDVVAGLLTNLILHGWRLL